jgi:hypothetical protein
MDVFQTNPFAIIFFSNSTPSAIKSVPAIESVHTLSRWFECGYKVSGKSTNVSHKGVLRQKLYFGSSTISNVIDTSDSSAKPNIFKRIYQKVMPEKLRYSSTHLQRSGAILSACCSHQVDVELFFKLFDMPDTYYSWWIVTELHAWMLCVRLVVGNTKEGIQCRNYMVTELYNDMDARAKMVGDMDRKDRQNVIWDIAEEFKNLAKWKKI